MRSLAMIPLLLAETALSLAQSVSITGPANKALFQQVGGTANVAVSAAATGVPSGGGVEFILDIGKPGSTSIKDFSSPFSCTFASVNAAEHTVDAYVINSSGGRLAAHDQHTQVGVGDLIVTLGDSITVGEVDDILTDNWSADGRNGPLIDPGTGQPWGGFQPILNDLLTAARGYPHSVINCGLAGETAGGGKTRAASIISQYPTARTWLIAYGTNDSAQGISTSTFKSNLLNIISQIQTAIPGASVCLPKNIYPTRAESRMFSYYDAMGDITRNTANLYWGADFDTLFRGNHMLYDHLTSQPGTWLATTTTHHPNGIGVQEMAALWKMAMMYRNILVGDGVVNSFGGTWADKIHIDGLSGIGLSPGNWLAVCQMDSGATAPPGMSLLGSTFFRLDLTGENNFAGGSLQVTYRIEDDNLPPAGATSWSQVWLALDAVALPTTKVVDPKSQYNYDLTAFANHPGMIAPVADVTPPVTTCLPNPLNPDPSGWYSTVPQITLSASDSSGMPVSAIYYHWDSNTDQVYSGPFAGLIGTHTLYYHSTDQSSNVEAAKSVVFKVADLSGPTTPTVSDGGRYSEHGVPVSASWSSQDPESSIAEYQYAIGTSPGATNIKGWTSAGTSTGCNWTPTGADGTTYYFSVKAKNGGGTWSAVGQSDGITVPIEVPSVGDAKRRPTLTPVLIRHLLITANMDGAMFAQQSDRSAGIPVLGPDLAAQGKEATVIGWTKDTNGERTLIDGETRNVLTVTETEPLAMPNLAWKTVALSPSGLLVTSWGRILQSGIGWVQISDGSLSPGLYVGTGKLTTLPSVGNYFVATGVSTIIHANGAWYPSIKPRQQADVIIYSFQ